MALPMFGGSAPPSWLNAELRYRRVDILKRDCGKSPESLFLLRIKWDKFDNLPSSSGILPVSWLIDREIICKRVILLMVGGMVPEISFWRSFKTKRFERRLSWGGISPNIRLKRRISVLRLEQFVSATGILSYSELLPRSRTSSLLRWPRGGNLPERVFEERLSSLTKVRLPRGGDGAWQTMASKV